MPVSTPYRTVKALGAILGPGFPPMAPCALLWLPWSSLRAPKLLEGSGTSYDIWQVQVPSNTEEAEEVNDEYQARLQALLKDED